MSFPALSFFNSKNNPPRARLPREVTTCFLFFIGVVLLNSWIGDDAFITFRTIKNFWGGHGLTYNITERVQAYTHPLWMMLIASFYFLTREFYYTVTLLSIALSAWSVYLLIRSSPQTSLSILLLWLLSFSKGFTDYSTSGLENPLSHLLLILFFQRFFSAAEEMRSKDFLGIFLLAGLLLLTRMDHLLLIAPALTFIVFRYSIRKTFVPTFLGFLPFLLWELFSLIYYGFPVPNTAYAKLNTGIAAWPLIQNGFRYMAACFQFDPVLMLTIPAVLVLILIRREKKILCAAAGIALHLIYVIKIGGDFMADRFLTPAFFCALICLLQMSISLKPRVLSFLLTSIFSVSLLSGYAPPLDILNGQKKILIEDRFADEKKFYYLGTGLLPNLLNLRTPNYMSQNYLEPPLSPAPDRNPHVILLKAVGYRPFEAGSRVHVIDLNALTDPLLSKLPAEDLLHWRIGHFTRKIPGGYLESIQTQTNQIKNPSLALYYDKLCVLTKGKLFSKERFKEIMKMNLKQYNSLLKDARAHP